MKKTLRSKFDLLFEFWDFMKIRKKFWLLPVIFMLLLVGLLVIFTGSSAISPFIYALF